MKKVSLIILSMLLCGNVQAGFNGFTMHSRANCVNNESISWDWTHDWWLITKSEHYYNNTLRHVLNIGAALTWRSAAVHWGEGRGGWKVHGMHWRHYTDNTYHLEQQEMIDDCDIYDGWWDKSK